MDDYSTKLLRSYLDNEPQKYTLPDSIGSEDIAEVSGLKPMVKSVSIYKYPNEHSAVLEGSNLWFCHEVHLGEEKNKIHIKHSAEMITGRSIQFNYRPTDKTDHLVVGDKMKVELHSHFSNRLQKRILVEQVRTHYIVKACPRGL